VEGQLGGREGAFPEYACGYAS